MNLADFKYSPRENTTMDKFKPEYTRGSIGPKIVKLPELEKNLIGQSFCEKTLRGCFDYIKNSIHPISDLRASANYRTNAACTILLKLLDN